MSTSYKLKPTYIRDNYFSAFVRDESVYRTNFRGVCINVRNSYNTGSRRDIFAVKLFAFAISICFLHVYLYLIQLLTWLTISFVYGIKSDFQS